GHTATWSETGRRRRRDLRKGGDEAQPPPRHDRAEPTPPARDRGRRRTRAWLGDTARIGKRADSNHQSLPVGCSESCARRYGVNRSRRNSHAKPSTRSAWPSRFRDHLQVVCWGAQQFKSSHNSFAPHVLDLYILVRFLFNGWQHDRGWL